MSAYVREQGHGYCMAAKIDERLTLFTIYNGVKSGAAIDLNKRRDLHNNYQTNIVCPRLQSALYLLGSHFLVCVFKVPFKRQEKSFVLVIEKHVSSGMCLKLVTKAVMCAF